MNKIPIKEAISSGTWFNCVVDWIETLAFRMRVSSFEKVNLSEVDAIEKINRQTFALENGDFWIMQLEIINLGKKAAQFIALSINISDNAGFEFSPATDFHLCGGSEYAKKSGLATFFGQECFPKIKRTGAITFFLPKEESEYFLTVQGGNIQEV